VCACVYESSEASAYSFDLAPNPTRARSYPLNINPKPDPKPDSISGPAGSGRVADLYFWLRSNVDFGQMVRQKYVVNNILEELYVEDTQLQLLWGMMKKK